MSFKKGDKVKIPTRKSISGQSDIKYFREKLDRMKVYPDFLVVDHVIDNEVTLYIKELGYSPKFLSSDLELFDGIAVAAAEDKLKYRMCDFSSFSEGCGVKVLNSRGMFEGVAFLRGTTWYVATNNPIGDGHNALPEEYKQYAFVWKLGSLIDQAVLQDQMRRKYCTILFL